VTLPASGKAPSIEILSIPAAAAVVGLTPKAMRIRVTKGEFPSRVLGKRRVILRHDLEQFLLRLPGTTVDQALRAVAAPGALPVRPTGAKAAAR
jgi:hypothetical protein